MIRWIEEGGRLAKPERCPERVRINLRVAQTKAILFLKSMSERVGYDIQRRGNGMMNFYIDSKFEFRVVLCRIRLFPKLISKIKWLWYGLPLILINKNFKNF